MSHINSPTTPGTTMTFMNSILDHRSPTTDQIFKTGIALSTHPPTPTIIEPLPPLDYFLINQLIALARPHLTKRELKRMDYMADARRSFYECHHKFQVAYRGLLDAYACAEILDARFEHLRRQLADNIADDNGTGVAGTHRQLCAIGIQRRRNNEDLRLGLEILGARTRNRQHVAAWYSDLKMLFLRDEMPWLVALGKQTYDWAVGQRKERPIMDSLPSPSPHEPRVMEGPGSDHCSDSGGTSTADVETRESDHGSNGNEGEE